MADPVRTCVGCRGRAPKAQLARMVWDGRLVLDPTQVRPGRGAYLHPDRRCIEQALRRRAVGRALKVTNASVDASDLDELAVGA